MQAQLYQRMGVMRGVLGLEARWHQIQRDRGMQGPAVGMEGRREPAMGDGGLRDRLQGLTALGAFHHPQL